MKIRLKFPIVKGHIFSLNLSGLKIIFILVLVVVGLPFIYFHQSKYCSSSPIKYVCSQVNDAIAIGNMCHDLCVLKSFQTTNCPTFHSGKEIVFEADFRESVPVVIKSKSLDLESEGENIVSWTDENGDIGYPTIEEFTKMIENHLSINYNVSMPKQVGLFALWPHSLNKDSLTEFQNEWLLKSTEKNLWTLSLDTEYVFSRLFKEYGVFPEVMGTCGGLYVVEKLEPINMPSFIQSVDFDGWVKRVKLALLILDFLEELDNIFESPLHLCDVKSEHFGLSDNGKLKYLDVDNVFFKPIVDKSVGDGTFCEKHSECDLFDCKGFCDLIENKCTGGVRNNNLQTVCEKMFLGQHLNFKSLGSTGLLISKHANRRVQEIVEKCANPAGATSEIRIEANEEIFQELKSSLKEIVKIHSD